MADDLIERVAIALVREKHRQDDLADPWWGDQASQPADTIRITPYEQDLWRSYAKAALAAIQPSEPDIAARRRDTSFDKTIKALTREAITESLKEIEEAFTALFDDRDEWHEQHENLLAVREQDITNLSASRADAFEALVKTQAMLETIDRTNSTCMSDVRQQIIANRDVIRQHAKGEKQ